MPCNSYVRKAPPEALWPRRHYLAALQPGPRSKSRPTNNWVSATESRDTSGSAPVKTPLLGTHSYPAKDEPLT